MLKIDYHANPDLAMMISARHSLKALDRPFDDESIRAVSQIVSYSANKDNFMEVSRHPKLRTAQMMDYNPSGDIEEDIKILDVLNLQPVEIHDVTEAAVEDDQTLLALFRSSQRYATETFGRTRKQNVLLEGLKESIIAGISFEGSLRSMKDVQTQQIVKVSRIGPGNYMRFNLLTPYKSQDTTTIFDFESAFSELCLSMTYAEIMEVFQRTIDLNQSSEGEVILVRMDQMNYKSGPLENFQRDITYLEKKGIPYRTLARTVE